MPLDPNPKPIDILLVEDSPTDAMLMREALEHATLLHTLHHVDNGVDAMEFLHRTGKYATVPRPDLILLDLNLPRKNGHEILAELKADGSLKLIPVIVLTASNAETDVARAYNLHANCYITKPGDIEAFAVVGQTIRAFWLTVVTLPSSRTP